MSYWQDIAGDTFYWRILYMSTGCIIFWTIVTHCYVTTYS